MYPALSVAQRLKSDPSVEALLYIGASGHLEERVAKEQGLDFVGLDVKGMPRKLSPQFIFWIFGTLKATLKAREILKGFRPTSVLGTGGYASAPPLAAAGMLGVPFVVHEPDAHPGLVNKLFARKASVISCGMEGALSRFSDSRGQVIFNGNPVTESFTNPPTRERACEELGLDPAKTTIVVTGGSQGAKAINDCIVSILPAVLHEDRDLQIVHQCGDKNIEDVRKELGPSLLNHPRYYLKPYFSNLAIAYAAADLVISRAGAMTISELAVTGTPAVFIPYPYAAQDHQMHNARALEKHGAAIVIDQSDLQPDLLLEKIYDLIDSPGKLKNMREQMARQGKPAAAQEIADQLKHLHDKSN